MNRISQFFIANKKVLLAIVFILIIIIAIYIGFKEIQANKENTNEISSSQHTMQESDKEVTFESEHGDLTESEKEGLMNGSGASDVDPDVALKQMDLKINMPQGIADKIDTEKFKNELSNYLVEQDFWGSTHTATSDGFLTWDVEKNVIYLTFDLDDPGNSHVEVTYYVEHNNYEFNYH